MVLWRLAAWPLSTFPHHREWWCCTNREKVIQSVKLSWVAHLGCPDFGHFDVMLKCECVLACIHSYCGRYSACVLHVGLCFNMTTTTEPQSSSSIRPMIHLAVPYWGSTTKDMFCMGSSEVQGTMGRNHNRHFPRACASKPSSYDNNWHLLGTRWLCP